MLTATLIAGSRCYCGAVSFHVATCPMCGDRVDKRSRPIESRSAPLSPGEQSETSKVVQERIARSKIMKQHKLERTTAGEAVEKIRRARKQAAL